MARATEIRQEYFPRRELERAGFDRPVIDYLERLGGAKTYNACTVADLPKPSLRPGDAGYRGNRGSVTDATASTFHSVVAGEGAIFVPVISDGVDWLVG